jgi:hypothetical protein
VLINEKRGQQLSLQAPASLGVGAERLEQRLDRVEERLEFAVRMLSSRRPGAELPGGRAPGAPAPSLTAAQAAHFECAARPSQA